jgi:hypothetical protein
VDHGLRSGKEDLTTKSTKSHEKRQAVKGADRGERGAFISLDPDKLLPIAALMTLLFFVVFFV